MASLGGNRRSPPFLAQTSARLAAPPGSRVSAPPVPISSQPGERRLVELSRLRALPQRVPCRACSPGTASGSRAVARNAAAVHPLSSLPADLPGERRHRQRLSDSVGLGGSPLRARRLGPAGPKRPRRPCLNAGRRGRSAGVGRKGLRGPARKPRGAEQLLGVGGADDGLAVDLLQGESADLAALHGTDQGMQRVRSRGGRRGGGRRGSASFWPPRSTYTSGGRREHDVGAGQAGRRRTAFRPGAAPRRTGCAGSMADSTMGSGGAGVAHVAQPLDRGGQRELGAAEALDEVAALAARPPPQPQRAVDGGEAAGDALGQHAARQRRRGAPAAARRAPVRARAGGRPARTRPHQRPAALRGGKRRGRPCRAGATRARTARDAPGRGATARGRRPRRAAAQGVVGDRARPDQVQSASAAPRRSGSPASTARSAKNWRRAHLAQDALHGCRCAGSRLRGRAEQRRVVAGGRARAPGRRPAGADPDELAGRAQLVHPGRR